MTRRADHLFDGIASFAALVAAARRAVRGKRSKPGAARFMAQLEPACLQLEHELRSGTYRPGRYREIVVHDPKRRLVSAAPFRDRVVHHALVHAIGPVFERGFIFDSYANRVGKGTHRAVARYEHFRDRHAFVLRADIWRYFPAIDHAILMQALARRIACRPTLALCQAVVEGSNEQEPVKLYFDGDDLFTPFERRRGLPLGNLTSQFFANVYLDALDHWVTEVLRLPYLRYVDDFALFSRSETQLQDAQAGIAQWLQGRRLRLHPAKTQVRTCAEPAQFLGYVLHAGGLRRLPGPNVARFRQRLAALRGQWLEGGVDAATVQARVGAWVAHARHAHSTGLRHALMRGGWFDPFLADGRPAPSEPEARR
ncbi:MAG: reverse transcriptase/maturase family protein [Hydrogenophaga sp.]|nr:reverse transcriptase/maturase family protein [Hydrogenophaga sp.]